MRKNIYMSHQMKSLLNAKLRLMKYVTCLQVVTILSGISLKAMEEDKEKIVQNRAQVPPKIHIVSPEGVLLIQNINIIAAANPKIAQLIPKVETLEDFKIAKAYLEFSKTYGSFLTGVTAISGNSQFLEQSQNVLNGLLGYAETLQGPICHPFRSKEDDEILKTKVCEINCGIAQNYLCMLTVLCSQPPSPKNQQIQEYYVKEIKRIRELLSGNPQFRNALQEPLQHLQSIAPALSPLFNPAARKHTPQHSKRLPKRMEQQKIVNQYEKIETFFSEEWSTKEFKECFDPHFHLTTTQLLTEELALSIKGIKGAEYLKQVQSLSERYMDLEQEGAQFRRKALKLETTSRANTLELQELIELYRFLEKRYAHLPQKNLPQLLQHIIVTFIHANKVEEAIKRLEVLKTLLVEKGSLSDEFIFFRASVLALTGDCSEWKRLLEEKRKKVEKEKAKFHQQKVQKIKKTLEETQKAQKELEFQEKKFPKEDKGEISPKKDTVSETYYVPPRPLGPSKFEVVLPKEKIKTRKPSQSQPIEEDKKSETQISSSTEKLEVSQKTYKLSKNAFKTYKKIREGNDKFPRKALYNLFEKLGCKVKISQGKGDHGKISAPLNMTVMNEEGIVAVFPEFITRPPETPLPLTVPNWDTKWDGRVPSYMMKSIVHALDYLQATDETVRK